MPFLLPATARRRRLPVAIIQYGRGMRIEGGETAERTPNFGEPTWCVAQNVSGFPVYLRADDGDASVSDVGSVRLGPMMAEEIWLPDGSVSVLGAGSVLKLLPLAFHHEPPADRGAIVLDESRSATVPDESRGAVVPAEARGAVVPDESRSATVPDESRSATVPDESRGATVPDESRGGSV